MKTITISNRQPDDLALLIKDMRKDGEIVVMSELLDDGSHRLTYKDENEPDEQEVYDHGFQIGNDIMEDNIYDMIEELGTDEDKLVGEVCQIESDHFRQFSPFEFFANDLNSSEDPEYLWDKYESGVYAGAIAAAKEYLAEDTAEGE